MGFFAFGDQEQQFPVRPLRPVSLFACGSCGQKPTWLSDLGVLGACPSDGSFQSWGARCGVQTLHSSGISWVLRVLLSQLCWEWVLWSVSQLFLPFPCGWCGYFLIHLTCRSYLASFWASFRGNGSVYSCGLSVPTGRGEFQRLLCHRLGRESPLWFFLKSSFLFWFWSAKK